MGDGGTRWGNPPPTRAIMGETAPNAVLYGGYREAIVGLLWGYRKAIVGLSRGY